MDSSLPDTSGYIDLSTLGQADTTDPVQNLTGGLLTTNDISSLFGGPVANLFNLASDTQQLLTDLLALIKYYVEIFTPKPLQDILNFLLSAFVHRDRLGLLAHGDLWSEITTITIGNLLKGMLIGGLGLKDTDFDDDATKGLETADRVIGFSLMLQAIVAAVDTVGEMLLADRWPKKAMEAIKDIPSETGINFASGFIIADVFKAAIGEQITRSILKAKRPSEPEWPIVRTMLRQHVVSDADLTTILENAGFPDYWIGKIKALETQPIPIGDIAAMYRAEIINPTDIDDMMTSLGFTDVNRDRLKKLYIEQAETEAGTLLRATARTLFRNYLITEDQYRAILTESHFPVREIDDDIAAITLEHQTGRTNYTVPSIKSAYQHKTLGYDAAIAQLVQTGYTLPAATEMIKSWDAPRLPRTHGLTEAQATKYYIAGLLTAPQFRNALAQLSVDAATIDFLVTHPMVAPGARVVKLTTGLITEAYLVGAIQQSDLEPAYRKAGAGDDTVPLLLAQAQYKYARHHEKGSGLQPITEGDIKEAFKLGLWDQTTATAALMNLGFSHDNATLILEIVNKGPIKPPEQARFNSVDEAELFLQSAGFAFQESTAGDYYAAIAMVEAAGITVIYPPNWVPPFVVVIP